MWQLVTTLCFPLQSHDLTDREANFYGQLGVVRTSSLTEIRRSFKRMSLDYHPDKNKDPNAVDVFRRIKSAYEVNDA